jgi:hypothetical protein
MTTMAKLWILHDDVLRSMLPTTEDNLLDRTEIIITLSQLVLFDINDIIFMSNSDWKDILRRYSSNNKVNYSLDTNESFCVRPLDLTLYQPLTADLESVDSTDPITTSRLVVDSTVYVLTDQGLLGSKFKFLQLLDTLPNHLAIYNNKIYASSAGYGIIQCLDMETGVVSILSKDYINGNILLLDHLLITLSIDRHFQIWNLKSNSVTFYEFPNDLSGGHIINLSGSDRIFAFSTKKTTLIYELTEDDDHPILVKYYHFSDDAYVVKLVDKNQLLIRYAKVTKILSVYKVADITEIVERISDPIQDIEVSNQGIIIVTSNSREVRILDKKTLENKGLSKHLAGKIVSFNMHSGVLFVLSRLNAIKRILNVLNPRTLETLKYIEYQSEISTYTVG